MKKKCVLFQYSVYGVCFLFFSMLVSCDFFDSEDNAWLVIENNCDIPIDVVVFYGDRTTPKPSHYGYETIIDGRTKRFYITPDAGPYVIIECLQTSRKYLLPFHKGEERVIKMGNFNVGVEVPNP